MYALVTLFGSNENLDDIEFSSLPDLIPTY